MQQLHLVFIPKTSQITVILTMPLKVIAERENSRLITSGVALAGRRPKDSDYTVDVLSRCSGSKDSSGKKTMKFIPLKEHGEPVVISPPLP